MVDYCRQDLNNRPIDSGGRTSYWEILRRVLWIGLATTVVLTYAWIQLQSLEISYRTERTRGENAELQRLSAAIKAEYASLVDPVQIDQEARHQGFIRYDEGVRLIEGVRPIFEPGQVLLAEVLPRR